MNVELRHLRLALAAAEYGSFRRAAAALSIRSSCVSRGVRDLEFMLGVVLFVRSSSGVRITAPGLHFIVQARHALTLLAEARESSLALEREGTGPGRMAMAAVSKAESGLPPLQRTIEPLTTLMTTVETLLAVLRTNGIDSSLVQTVSDRASIDLDRPSTSHAAKHSAYI